MFLNAEQAKARLENENNLATKVEIIRKKMNNGGRREGVKNLSDETKILIGATSAEIGPTKTAEQFGITKQQAFNYERGRSNFNGKSNEDNKNKIKALINTKKSKLAREALLVLSKSIGLISEEDLKDTSAKTKAAIAKDMSQVVRNLTDENKINVGVGVKFEIYSPGEKSEDSYKQVEIGES